MKNRRMDWLRRHNAPESYPKRFKSSLTLCCQSLEIKFSRAPVESRYLPGLQY